MTIKIICIYDKIEVALKLVCMQLEKDRCIEQLKNRYIYGKNWIHGVTIKPCI